MGPERSATHQPNDASAADASAADASASDAAARATRRHNPIKGAVAVALATWFADRLANAAGARLLVFLHVAVKQRAFQSELQGALTGITVTAVGRIGDFDRALKEGQDAVLTLPVILAAHGLTVHLRGQRKGSPDEKYSLVAVDAAPDPARVTALGTLDLLGREGMIEFVRGLVGGSPKIERVTKVEDLLPLLQMQRVDAIMLPSRLFNEIKAASRLNLVARELPNAIGLPAVSTIGMAGAEVLSALGRLPRNLLDALGVDQWR
jgi:hypothetical protein